MRTLVAMFLLAGLLMPVVSSVDDRALLSAALDELSPTRPEEFRQAWPTSAPCDSSAVFWIQFEHMDGPVSTDSLPVAQQAGIVYALEAPLQVSTLNPRPGRGPPAFLL